MKRVFQKTVDKDRGDCMRACVASLFELELSQVPNFILFDEKSWFHVYYHFFLSMGWAYRGFKYLSHIEQNGLPENESVRGLFPASVRSRTLKDRDHAVLIDKTGTVVHDPNPNQKFRGVNVLKTKELNGVEMYHEKKTPMTGNFVIQSGNGFLVDPETNEMICCPKDRDKAIKSACWFGLENAVRKAEEMYGRGLEAIVVLASVEE